MRMIFAFFLLSCGLLNACKHSPNGRQLNMEGFKLKEITERRVDRSNEKMILFCFRTDCPYCAELTVRLLKAAKDYPGIILYMVSMDSDSLIINYMKASEVTTYANVIVSRDTAGFLFDQLNITGVPFTAFLDEENRIYYGGYGALPSEKISELLLQ